MPAASSAADAFGRAPPGPIIAVLTVSVLWAMGAQPSALARVPDATGLDAAVAGTLLEQDGFTVETLLRDGGGTEGTVVGQDPRGGEFRHKGTAVTLAVTRGAEQVHVPDLGGLPVNEAREALAREGLRLGDVVYRVFADRESGRVVSTEPAAGSRVDAGTEVALIAALG